MSELTLDPTLLNELSTQHKKNLVHIRFIETQYKFPGQKMTMKSEKLNS